MVRKQFSLTMTWFIFIVLLLLSVRPEYAEWLIVSIMDRSLAVTRFSGSMASGKVVYDAAGNGKWAPVAPKTVAKMLMNSQCKE